MHKLCRVLLARKSVVAFSLFLMNYFTIISQRLRQNKDKKFIKTVKLLAQNTPTAPLHRGKTPPRNECPGYDIKQSDGKIPVMLELWGNAEHSFIAIASRSTLTRNGST